MVLFSSCKPWPHNTPQFYFKRRRKDIFSVTAFAEDSIRIPATPLLMMLITSFLFFKQIFAHSFFESATSGEEDGVSTNAAGSSEIF